MPAIQQTNHARRNTFRSEAPGVSPVRLGQLELFSSDEEQFIQRELAKKLYTPHLPNAGQPERKWVARLRAFARDESLVVNIRSACRLYAEALAACLPAQEYVRHPRAGKKWLTLPGCYYTRKGAITPHTNKGLYEALQSLRADAQRAQDRDRKWLADFLLLGCPKPVSNFKMECLYLLRGSDGNVTRLVRLVNTKGEMSEGREIGGADMLPNEMYGGSEKFRIWASSKGNFAWGGPEGGAGNNEVQALQWDVTEESAYQTVKLIEYCGAHEIRSARGNEPAQGLWFFNGCAIDFRGGKWLMPDADGIIWDEGNGLRQGYAISSKGRELDFAHGRPVMPLTPAGVPTPFAPDQSEWEAASRTLPVLGGFFREVGRRFYDTAGGPGGWMSLAMALGYAAGPEYFEARGCLPSIFIPGEMGSGKTFYANWTMGLQGFPPTKGLGLGKGSFVTVPGLCAQLENYSSLMVWYDEYREHEITPEKIAVIRAAYDRQLANKWTPDGVQRVIRTTPMVSGETATGDAATHSRYTQLQLSRQDRLYHNPAGELAEGDHLAWLRDNRPHFVRFWQHIMEHRPEFARLVLHNADLWFESHATKRLPERNRATYALAYGAFMAAVAMFGSHTAEEVAEFHEFMVARAGVSAADVDHEKFVNVFLQDLLTAYKAGAVGSEHFRIKALAPVADEFGLFWLPYELYFEPLGVISALQIHLRKANQSMTLRYKDLRDQLSRNREWWIPGPNKMRIGAAVSRASLNTWGIRVDLHPLGRLHPTEAEMLAAIDGSLPALGEAVSGEVRFKRGEGDPRKGPLFSIIEGVLNHEDSVK